MRYSPRTPPLPEQRFYDIVISQAVGKLATGTTIRALPTGGSEFQVVVLAEALAERGYKVAVLTPDGAFARDRGVDYIPLMCVVGAFDDPFTCEPRRVFQIQCNTLVSERMGKLPESVQFNRIVFDLHDIPDDRLGHVMQALANIPDSAVVSHSPWAAALLDEWPRVNVIPCMLPDEFYGAATEQPKRRDGERVFVFASAVIKGLAPTVRAWSQLRTAREMKRARLIVCGPGYDRPDESELAQIKGVEYRPDLSPAATQELLRQSDGIFMVSSFPETFGIALHQAEAAGKPAYVLQLHDGDALATTIAGPTVTRDPTVFSSWFTERTLPHMSPTPHDFRVSTHIDRWIEVLGLKQQKENAA